VRWLEEPTQPDNLKGSAAIADALTMPVATGENESTRWAFQQLIEHRAADILQPDVTVVGGVSEWMKVAALASAHGVPVAPHYVWDVHVHLAAATPAVVIQEYFERDSDLVNFDDVLRNPLRPENGVLKVPEAPGLGLELDEEALARFRQA
jgi:D-arabinonate dehydratase